MPDIPAKINQYGSKQISLLLVSIVLFLPLTFFLFGFVVGGEREGILSTLFFTSFIAALSFKLLVQRILFQDIARSLTQSEFSSNPSLTQMYENLKKSYSAYTGLTAVTLSGLIPVLHLLAIWIAVPAGALVIFTYAEFRFFRDSKKYLESRATNPTQLPLGMLYFSLVAYYVTLPLMALGLWYGLQALNL